MGYLITAWVLAQVSDRVLESFDAPEWAMRYMLIALAIGYPIALIISWVFEFTPKGVLLDSQADRTVKLSQESRRRLDFSILLILAVLVIFMGLERFLFSDRDGGICRDAGRFRAGLAASQHSELSPEKRVNRTPGDLVTFGSWHHLVINGECVLRQLSLTGFQRL